MEVVPLSHIWTGLSVGGKESEQDAEGKFTESMSILDQSDLYKYTKFIL